MADDANKPAEGEVVDGGDAAPAGGKKKKLLLLISVGVAVLGAAIGGGVFFMLSGEKKADTEAAPVAVFFDLPQFSVNLMSEGGDAHFLKAKVALEFASNEDMAKATVMLPVLQDDYQAFFRQMRVEDFRGNAALVRLKDALLLRTNQILAPVPTRNVLFREILVQ